MDSSAAPIPTVTQRDQWMVEYRVFETYALFADLPHSSQSFLVELQRDKHIEYLTKSLKQLSSAHCVLDANRPWLCYWILHSIALLGKCVAPELEDNVIDFLSRCQDPDGGYGGGPGQMPHLATTYAAVNALITVGGERSLSSINRDKLYVFFQRMKHPSGGFRMHDGGEIDVRACYTAISVASVLNILDNELVQNVGDYILSCQTYEGGIAAEPGSEAHGGYTFCGLAVMILINEDDRLDLASLIDWAAFRQGKEGGFQGRTNKLVDGCYSFWQGGDFALFQRIHSIIDELWDAGERDCVTHSPQTASGSDMSQGEENSDEVDKACHSRLGGLNTSSPLNLNNIGYNFIEGHAEMEPLFDSIALQKYILLCCQDLSGGLRDKLGKPRDHYHTCYCLSGLSVSQYSQSKDEDSPPLPSSLFGPYSNLLEPIHPLFNVVLKCYHEAHEFFAMP